MITITKAPAYLAIQDLGRPNTLSSGVPRGGAMDRFAASAANCLVKNAADAAVLEWALTPGAVRFDAPCIFAIAGALADVAIAHRDVPPLTRLRARAGETLTIGRITRGRFLYIAFAGGIDVPIGVGSRATYLPGHFGGFDGRLLKTGDSLRIDSGRAAVGNRANDRGDNASPDFFCPKELTLDYARNRIRITRTVDSQYFDESAWRLILNEDFKVAHASDRTGYRLVGRPLSHKLGTLPSEVGCPGAIQVPTDGNPIVLMADAPTVGGYPRIGVVCEADLPIVAQRTPGETMKFEVISIEESQRVLLEQQANLAALARLSGAPEPFTRFGAASA